MQPNKSFPWRQLEYEIGRRRGKEMTNYELMNMLGISARSLRRFRNSGITRTQADRYAVRAGIHPANVWGSLWWAEEDE